MTGFETHPAGTADLVKRLRSNTPNMVIGHASMHEAADRIEQLEAELTRATQNNDMMFAKGMSHGQQVMKDTGRLVIVDNPDSVSLLVAALTRANAATAAAYDVAAQIADDFVRMRERQIETEKAKAALYVNVPQIMRWQAGKVQSEAISASIRTLATPDQTAALDKLIAEAVEPLKDAMRYYETQFCEGFCEDMPDRSVTNEGMENNCSGCKARAILAASKKGRK